MYMEKEACPFDPATFHRLTKKLYNPVTGIVTFPVLVLYIAPVLYSTVLNLKGSYLIPRLMVPLYQIQNRGKLIGSILTSFELIVLMEPVLELISASFPATKQETFTFIQSIDSNLM